MVKRRNPFEIEHGERARSLRQCGYDKTKILDTLGCLGRTPDEQEKLMLLLEVSLNERSSRDVDHLLKPDCPTRVTYQKEISQGHLCWAETDSLDQGGFSFLIAIPELSDDQAKSLIKNNNNELCRLAYKQYHEGNPHDIGVNPENNQVMSAYSWVNSSMLGHLLP